MVADDFSQAVVETTREPMLGLDKDLRVTFANPAFYATFQAVPRQTIGHLIYDLGNKQWNIPELRKLLEEILPRHSSFNDYEIEHNFLDIGPKIMRLNARTLLRPAGNDSQPMILLAIEDITERKQLEKKLAKYTSGLQQKAVKDTKTISLGKAREAAILRSIGDGLIVLVDVDKGGKIAYVNQAFEDMVGWKQQEVINKFVIDVMPREDRDGNVVPFQERIVTKVLAGQSIVADINQPFYYVRKDGTKFPVASIITPIMLGGKIIGAVETFRDITKESAADKAKTEFASLVSHQLRTPFSTINWYVELLLAGDVGPLNKKQIQYLEEVYQASQRMVNLINVLLSISRIEMGISMDETEPVNPVALAEVILAERRLETRQKRLKIDTAYAQNVPEIQADPKHITMIFQNLLSNAIKYTPAGGTIKLGVRVQDADLLISVVDTGMGIPEAAKAKVFTRFFRADNAQAHEAEGVGLGLYILKAIIDEMGGRIWFNSTEGRGTSFYVSIPLPAASRRRPAKGQAS